MPTLTVLATPSTSQPDVKDEDIGDEFPSMKTRGTVHIPHFVYK